MLKRKTYSSCQCCPSNQNLYKIAVANLQTSAIGPARAARRVINILHLHADMEN